MHFYMNNLKMLPFATVSKRIKFFRINLTKVVQDLCTENYKGSLKEKKEILNKSKACHIHEL